MSLLIVGSVAFDTIETPFGKVEKIIGGAATYISLAASYFGEKTRLVSIVGSDFGEENLQKFSKRGIDIEGIQVMNDQKTFHWSGRYHNDMNSRDTIFTKLNSLADFDPEIPDSYQDVEFLMLGNLSPVVQRKVIERLHHRPKLIAMDTMNFWIDIRLEELKQTIAMVDLLSINDEEARMLSGEYSLAKSAQKIIAMGPKYLIIKKGEHGALLFSKDKMFFAPALPLEEIFDPTGAGDTFAGGLMGYLTKNKEVTFDNLKNGIILGSTLASFSVEKFGTERIENLTQKEIYERVQKFVDLVEFNYPAS